MLKLSKNYVIVTLLKEKPLKVWLKILTEQAKASVSFKKMTSP
jgi:hypothetical protein